jgi:hypothetical protein
MTGPLYEPSQLAGNIEDFSHLGGVVSNRAAKLLFFRLAFVEHFSPGQAPQIAARFFRAAPSQNHNLPCKRFLRPAVKNATRPRMKVKVGTTAGVRDGFSRGLSRKSKILGGERRLFRAIFWHRTSRTF